MVATISMNIVIVIKFCILHIIWLISINNYTFCDAEIKSAMCNKPRNKTYLKKTSPIDTLFLINC